MISYNPEFYLMKHFSAFVEPGAYKMETSDENCLAFKNLDAIVFIYYNKDEAIGKSFKIGDLFITVQLEAQSFNTFSIKI